MKANNSPGTEVDWLVIFLVLDSLDLKKPVNHFLDAIKEVKLKASTRVYFLRDTVRHIRDPHPGCTAYNLSINEFVYNETTGITTLNPIELKGVNTTDAYAWLEALIKIRGMHQAKFSALIPWSHGAGIGIFNPDTRVLSVQKNELSIIRSYQRGSHPFEKNKFNCTTAEETTNSLIIHDLPEDKACLALQQLFVSEIADGLGETIRRPVFDIVVMNNCTTQIIDNCYNLHAITRYYLAAITSIRTNGYDFAGFIGAINDGSLAPAPDCVLPPYECYLKAVIKTLLEGYERSNPDVSKDTALVANDLNEILQLKPLLNDVCDYFTHNVDTVFPVIEDCLGEFGLPVAGRDAIDMVRLFDTIQSKLGGDMRGTFDEIYKQLRAFLENIIVDRRTGEHLEATDFHSCSIYIPVSIVNIISPLFCCQYFRKFADSQFVRETKWDDFTIQFTRWRIKKRQAALRISGTGSGIKNS